MTAPATLDTDRLSVASLLLTLAESFAIESAMWANLDCRAELIRSSHQLAHLARLTLLGESDLERADAFAEAGRTVLGNVQGARRFFRAILTEPRVRAGGER